MYAHLQLVVKTKNISFDRGLSSFLGLAVLAGFSSDAMVPLYICYFFMEHEKHVCVVILRSYYQRILQNN